MTGDATDNALLNSVTSNSSWIEFTTSVNLFTPATTTFVSSPSYYSHYCSGCDSKVDTAYKVVRALMTKKILKIKEVQDFFEAMDAVISTL